MKRAIGLLVVAFAVSGLAAAQSNPVMDSVRHIVQRQQKNLEAAAEEMPGEKYSFRPTAQQMTFGTLVMHVAESNHFLCARLSGDTPAKLQLKPTDPKAKLVAAMKTSFSYCDTALAKVNDSGLGEQVKVWGGHEMLKAGAAISLTDDLADHYSQASMYLRLNGLLPPTAKKKGE